MIILVLLVSACGPDKVLTKLPDTDVETRIVPVYVSTSRALDETGFGAGRSEELRFGRFDISIPPQRDPGSINWPPRSRQADPARDFLVANARLYPDPRAFRHALAPALARERGESIVYVHGFNTGFAKGLYRIAQLTADLDLPGVEIHYSWPSAARPLGYVHDRDSALYARDGLEALLDNLAAAGSGKIMLVAHSMGSLLAMETLRQMAIRDNPTLRNLAGVVLLSPDIDVDLFHAQAREIEDLPQPFILFTSHRDRALSLSARLTGRPDRLGNIGSVAEIADLEVLVLETGEFSVGLGHMDPGSSPAMLELLRNAAAVSTVFEDDGGRLGFLPGTVLTIRNATEIILAP
ncbi:alpha/beta hydrolase [Alkalilacustris brevis]|uniref:alpha/beta hydrolase n=1 Tax=Alkalilacustris brevis TaxID=2026338 RepID=UPI0013904EB9|nr:alpha/beta fold hydrolase [Alkalilacustris brevis]